jgi:hypothetical protein
VSESKEYKYDKKENKKKEMRRNCSALRPGGLLLGAALAVELQEELAGLLIL